MLHIPSHIRPQLMLLERAHDPAVVAAWLNERVSPKPDNCRGYHGCWTGYRRYLSHLPSLRRRT